VPRLSTEARELILAGGQKRFEAKIFCCARMWKSCEEKIVLLSRSKFGFGRMKTVTKLNLTSNFKS